MADSMEPLRWLRRQLGSKTGDNPKGFGNKQEDEALHALDKDDGEKDQNYMPKKHRSRTGYDPE